MNATTVFSISLTGFLLTGCGVNIVGGSNNSASGVDSAATSIESGITAISGLADEQAGSNLASGAPLEIKDYVAKAYSQLLPRAEASVCGRAIFENCQPGVAGATRSVSYNACELSGGRSLSGQVTLSYSDLNCQMDIGDTVNRGFSLELQGLYGGTLNLSSANAVDYRGNVIGGGGMLTRISANDWQMDIAGKRKVLTRNGRTLFDVQIRTTAPISVRETLDRNGRVVDGGSYEVIHNLAKFTATYSPKNLTWASGCCHPVSGSLEVNYAGSLNGNGTVTFNGCGSATLNKGGLIESVNLNYCE